MVPLFVIRMVRSCLWWRSSHSFLSSSMELVEVIAMFNSISKALEVDISHFWAKTDSKIIWNLLVGKTRYANEVRLFVDAIWELHLSGSILSFLWANKRCNSTAHALASHVYLYLHSIVWFEDQPPWENFAIHFDFPYLLTRWLYLKKIGINLLFRIMLYVLFL